MCLPPLQNLSWRNVWKINKILLAIVGPLLLGALIYGCYGMSKVHASAKPTYVKIGDYTYMIIYTSGSLGSTAFLQDDSKGKRIIFLPDLGTAQLQQSFMHEELHACMHNHQHNFTNDVDLAKHLHRTYSEEEVVEIIAPCLLAQKSNTLF